MSRRARRLVAAAAAVVLLLFAGRWLVTFLADRWWAAALSPEALDAITRWHLLGLFLDAGAILIASVWFALQAVLVTRAIGSVQVERRVGELRLREAIPVRLLALGAVASGVLLGVVTGTGAQAWRGPVALARENPRYGIDDPLLGVDLGVLVGEYPVWDLAHEYAVLLALLGLGFALVLYLAIGAVRRHEGSLELHPDARRHLGGLLAVLALVFAVGYLLGPYRLATTVDVPLGLAAASTRVLAAHAAAGAAIAVAIISVAWAVRARHSLLGASWAVLALAAVTERLVVPAFVAEGTGTEDHAEHAREMDAVFYGITLAGDLHSSDSLPAVTAIWDVAALGAWAERDGAVFLGAAPQGVSSEARWLVARRPAPGADAIEVVSVAAGSATTAGLPQLHGSDSANALVIRAPRSLPDAAEWRVVQGGGVPTGSLLRRAAIAWARQAPAVFTLPAGTAIDWALDPRARVSRLVPTLEWRAVGLIEDAGRVVWLVSGLATVDRAPLTLRQRFGGRQVAGAVPALVATVDADDGAVRLYLDPAADSLGRAWGRTAGALVSDEAALPGWIREAMPYPGPWLELQLAVLQQPHWGLGRQAVDPVQGEPAPPAPVWGANGPRLQVLLEDPATETPATLIEAGRQGGLAFLERAAISGSDLPGMVEMGRNWRRAPAFGQLRDSVRAAGDTLVAGALRVHAGPGGLRAWQPFRAEGRRGDPALRWIGVAHGTLVGGGRTPGEVWRTLAGDGAGSGGPVPLDVVNRFEAIRAWVRRADSALARGDLTAFSRAWEAVRGLLAEPPRE